MPPGVTTIAGDLTDRDDVDRALKGVDRAFLILADDSGATFARAAGFDYNIVPWVAAARDDVVRLPYPHMRSPFVEPADIAASAVALLSAAEPMPATYWITGPEAGSLRAQAAEINSAFGRSYVVQQLGERETRIGLLDEMPDPARTSVQRLTGRQPRSFRTTLTGARRRTHPRHSDPAGAPAPPRP